MKNETEKCIKKNFVFEYKHAKYNINIEKLLKVLAALNFALEEEDVLSQENFKHFLKSHGLLLEEFLEFISD